MAGFTTGKAGFTPGDGARTGSEPSGKISAKLPRNSLLKPGSTVFWAVEEGQGASGPVVMLDLTDLSATRRMHLVGESFS